MNPIDILKGVESDLASLTSLPGEIRAKVGDGVAELTRIRDDIAALIATLTGSARTTLASLQNLTAHDAAPADVMKPVSGDPVA